MTLVPKVYDQLILWMLVFSRISTLLISFAIFKQETIALRVIIALSAILAFYVTSGYAGEAIQIDLFSLRLIQEMFFQMIIGFFSALALNIIFDVFIAAGQIISLQIGLGMASLIDPRFGFITSLTNFYVILATLIFLFLNGHLFVIKMIMDSFVVFPVYHEILAPNLLSHLLTYAGIIFTGSIMLSMSIIVTIFLTNVSLSVMTKFAPQFNIFSIGINIQLILGLIFIYLTFGLFVDNSTNLVTECVNTINKIFSKEG